MSPRGRGLAALVLSLSSLSACGDGGSRDQAGPSAGDEQEYEAFATVLEAKGGRGPELCLGPIAESYPPQCGGPPVEGWDWAKVPGRETAAGTTWASVFVRGTYDGRSFRLTALPPPPPRGDGGATAPDFSPACDTPEVVDRSQGSEAFGQAWTQIGGVPEQVALWVSNDGGRPEEFVVNVVVRPGAADEARARIRAHYGGPLCVVERDQRTSAELAAVQDQVVRLLGQEVLTASADEQRGVVVVTVVLATDEMRQRVEREVGAGVVELDSRLRPVGRRGSTSR